MTPGAPGQSAVDRLDLAVGSAPSALGFGFRLRRRVPLGEQRGEVAGPGHPSDVAGEPLGPVPLLHLIDNPSGVVVIASERLGDEPLHPFAR